MRVCKKMRRLWATAYEFTYTRTLLKVEGMLGNIQSNTARDFEQFGSGSTTRHNSPCSSGGA